PACPALPALPARPPACLPARPPACPRLQLAQAEARGQIVPPSAASASSAPPPAKPAPIRRPDPITGDPTLAWALIDYELLLPWPDHPRRPTFPGLTDQL
ncbi:MAG: hypothetical protein AAF078_13975, partial [Planctomycetota bacterium]